jgi:hypothetical protein
MTVWHIVWGGGSLDFDDQDARELVITKNRKQLIKQFQNRKHMIYTQGSVWRSFDLGTTSMSKMETLRALTGPLNFYYKYHEDATAYYTVMVDQNMEELYTSGYQDYNHVLKVKLIETVLDSELQNTIIPGMLLLEGAA